MDSSSEVITTKKGIIEFAKKGSGPYVMMLHGSPGVHDGYSCYSSYLVDAGLGIIAPTRPGFGRTPLASGSTPEEAADLLAALLDELSIDQIVMFGISGGGPTSLQFALRHPNRCKALMTEVAVTGGFTHPKAAELGGAATKFAITSATFSRMGASYAVSNP